MSEQKRVPRIVLTCLAACVEVMEEGLEFGGAPGYPQGSCGLRCCRCILSVLVDVWNGICSLCRFLRKQLRLIWGQRESRRLFVFIMVLYTFLGLEVTYGYFTTSIGTLSEKPILERLVRLSVGF